MHVIPRPSSITSLGGAPVRLREAWSGRVDVRLSADVDLAEVVPVGLSPTGTPDDERYRLVIAADGVTLSARERVGVTRGLATLRQIVASSPRDGDEILVEPVEVVDGPRIAWRGLSLDVVRCFFGPDEVRRVVDMLELYKLNVLHLHLTDDQGWRLEVPGRPKLTEVGGAGAMGDRPGGFYRREDLADLVAYAVDHGVTVVPEVDMPGHSAAALRSYPELGTGNLLLPETEGVLEFAEEVVRALADVSPGPFIHIGGDEAFGMDPDAYASFVDAVRPMVAAAGKRMITWQEGTRSDLQPDDVVQYWMSFDAALDKAIDSDDLGDFELPEGLDIPREMIPAIVDMFRVGRADLGRALERGAKVILSPASKVYLDKPYAGASSDPSQQEMVGRLGLRAYPPSTVAESFDWDPAAAIPGELASVAGVEAAMWGETITDAAELEFMLLPRLCGIAERAWSGDASSTWPEFRTRLGAQSPIWREQGWNWFATDLVDWS